MALGLVSEDQWPIICHWTSWFSVGVISHAAPNKRKHSVFLTYSFGLTLCIKAFSYDSWHGTMHVRWQIITKSLQVYEMLRVSPRDDTVWDFTMKFWDWQGRFSCVNKNKQWKQLDLPNVFDMSILFNSTEHTSVSNPVSINLLVWIMLTLFYLPMPAYYRCLSRNE